MRTREEKWNYMKNTFVLIRMADGRGPVITKGGHVPSAGAVGTAWAPAAVRSLAELAIDTAGHSWWLLAAPSAGLELKTGGEPNVVVSLTLRMFLLLYIRK